MLNEDQKVYKIAGPVTRTVLDSTGYLVALIASEAAPGLSFTIQDKAATPNKLLAAFVPTLGPDSDLLVKQWTPPQPVRMEGGIDIVSLGAGEVYLWVWYLFEPEPQT